MITCLLSLKHENKWYQTSLRNSLQDNALFCLFVCCNIYLFAWYKLSVGGIWHKFCNSLCDWSFCSWEALRNSNVRIYPKCYRIKYLYSDKMDDQNTTRVMLRYSEFACLVLFFNCVIACEHWPDSSKFIIQSAELWNRWIRLSCIYNKLKVERTKHVSCVIY